MTKTAKRIVIAFIFFSPLIFANAEAFRIRKMHIANLIPSQTDTSQYDCGVYDAFAVFLPDDKTFLDGIEIKMVIPEEIASYPNAVAASIYDDISPVPSAAQIDYSGSRIFVDTIPGRLSWILQIPLATDNSIKENQFSTTIDTIPNANTTNIFLRFRPVIKGIPEETLNAKISVTARPILKDLGRLALKINSADEKELKQFSVYIDDEPIDIKKDIILSTGHHNLSLISEDYRNEHRKFYIEQAAATNLEISLKGVEPTLLVNVPDGTTVYLDDKICNEIGREFVIGEGNHSIKFVVGNYEIVRTITATKGKTYKANFEVDLTITDDEN